MRFASRMNRLGTESAFEVLAEARRIEATGKSVIHLEIGEPDFDTPGNIIEAAYSAMSSGATHYTPAAGIPEVRDAIAASMARRGGVPVDPDQVVVVPGSKNILHFALLSCVEAGEEVILPDPGYPVYRSLTDFVGAVARPIRLREEMKFGMDMDELESLISPRTRMVIINSPQNPTGGVLSTSDLDRLAELAIQHDLLVLSDEIYSRICFSDLPAPIWSRPGMAERTIVLDGLSKTYAMCGWRLGFGVMPRELAQRMETLLINTSSCAAAFTQLAAVEALDSPSSEDAVIRMVAEFRERRDVLVEGLNSIPGVSCLLPEASFYAFPNITATGMSSREMASRLLHESGVAVLAGESFGEGGKGFIRLAYTKGLPEIREAVQRVARFVATAVPAQVS
ncbi:MAG TPA: pyridoxal phosphate-dependent aminotransferase [Candidatus Dormibacteraeota bacterium]|nr:pyridoxal phosphate-dependent aminotransferase [Candidatus Dormibacteraeota bacterium]